MPTNDAMLQAFDKFKSQIDDAYAQTREHLRQGDFEAAQVVLARIGQTHARTSMSMRNYLIKHGLITGDD